MRIQQDMRHRQTHHIGGEKQITRFSHENFLLLFYALFVTIKIGNIQLGGNSVQTVKILLGLALKLRIIFEPELDLFFI